MKRGCLFGGLLILALGIVYFQPVFFPQKAPEPRHSVTQNSADGIPTTMNFEPIPAQGYAKFIGEPVKTFAERFGEPVKTFSSGYGYTVSLYPTKGEEYVEVNSEKGKVTAIKITGKEAGDLEPFSIGMKMSELSQLTMIYPNFTLSYGKEDITLELMEEDMNYRPLIAFDNDTFAVLFFDQANSQLFAAAFVDQETLLKLAPYQIVSGKAPSFQETTDDWAKIDFEKAQNSLQLLNILRNFDQLPAYFSNPQAEDQAETLLADFLEKPEDILQDDRLDDYHNVVSKENRQPFLLSTDEWNRLLQKHEITKAQGIFELPTYDPTFQLLTYYSDPYLHPKFSREEPETASIAISKENMVVLLQEQETKVEESGSN